MRCLHRETVIPQSTALTGKALLPRSAALTGNRCSAELYESGKSVHRSGRRKEKAMQEIKIIIGASYGDEGKGLAADYFGSRGTNLINVLTNGGPQRGHTVEMPDGLRHVFKHFGAASFRGAASYFDRQFLVNPMEFIREYEELSSIHRPPMSFMHPDCRFTTPWDMMVNQMLTEKKGVHNSCGFGIWETVLRYQRGWGISFEAFAKMTRDDRLACLRRIRDLYFYERIREIENMKGTPHFFHDSASTAADLLTAHSAAAGKMHVASTAAAKVPGTAPFSTDSGKAFESMAAGLPYFRDMYEFFFSEELLFHFEEDFECMRRLCPLRPESFLKYFQTVIFENAQGLLLDGNMNKQRASGRKEGSARISGLADICGRPHMSTEQGRAARTGMSERGANGWSDAGARKSGAEHSVFKQVSDHKITGTSTNAAGEEFTTPSTTGIGRVLQTVERVFRGADTEVCYITRSYLTRHGDGPMENELTAGQVRDLLPGVGADATNVENSFQGRLRYGMMDSDLLIKRIQDDYARACRPSGNMYRSSLMVTHINEYAEIDTDLMADSFDTLYLSDGRTGRDVMIFS